ncbi:MAG TPA: thiolase family protein [Saprospiraceae bacterium]|nr:thiolase family protein [Saprospiraceae bacterium]
MSRVEGNGYHDRKKGLGILFDDVFIAAAARTPFGKLCGTLGRISPTDLGIYASREAIKRSGIPAGEIDQLIFSNIGQSSADAYFLPRHIGLYSGLQETVPALLVQRICGSGIEAIAQAAEQIQLGKADSVLCGGAENMSLSPSSSFGSRMGHPLGKPGFVDMLWESLEDTAAVSMGRTAENVARRHVLTRDLADQYAKRSVDCYLSARTAGFFEDEIHKLNSAVFECAGLHPRKVNLPKGVRDFNTDEHVRPSDLKAMGDLPASFEKEGVQTAGNSSGIVDGASAAVVVSGRSCRASNLQTMSRVLACSTTALDPKLMGLGPVSSIRLLLEISGLELDDIGLFEINEAFASQYLGCEMELGLDREKCNVHGGAIAIGHPLAATGTRLAMTLSRAMRLRKVRYGIASACIGGGQGIAMLLENTSTQ